MSTTTSSPRASLQRAFSLIEIAATLAIAGIITAAALSATVVLHRSFVTNRKLVSQSDDLRITLEHVLARVRNAGGGPVRPWQAVSLSCGSDPLHPMPACDAARHQQRLHVVTADAGLQAVINRVSGTKVFVERAGGACPITESGTALHIPIVLVPPEDQLQVLGGAAWRVGACIPLPEAECGCDVTAASGRGGFSAPGELTALTDSKLARGVLIGGTVTSFYVDTARNTLMVLRDLEGFGVAQSTALMPTVTAFEPRLGYDVDGNGVLDPVLQLKQLPSSPQALRSVRVGIALSSVATDTVTRKAPFFDVVIGDLGNMTVALEGTAMMRANGLFQ